LHSKSHAHVKDGSFKRKIPRRGRPASLKTLSPNRRVVGFWLLLYGKVGDQRPRRSREGASTNTIDPPVIIDPFGLDSNPLVRRHIARIRRALRGPRLQEKLRFNELESPEEFPSIRFAKKMLFRLRLWPRCLLYGNDALNTPK